MKFHLIVVPVALLMMLFALVGGVMRLMANQGMVGSTPLSFSFPFHGEIMVFGFLAVLITTERYIGSLTFKLSPVIHLMPYLVALGAVLKVVGMVAPVEPLNVVGSVLLAMGVVIYMYLIGALSRLSARPLPFRFMLLAALLLLIGIFLSIPRSPVGNMTFFLLGFPILTILGERVELSRFLSSTVYRWSEWGLWAAAVAFLLLLREDERLMAIGWALLMGIAVLPLLGSELALVKAGERAPERFYRYLGRHLWLAYSWFFLGLILVIAWALSGGSPAMYDAATHSLAVGFVGTMILAHAPAMAPALLNLTIAQEKVNLLPLELLTVGNLLRVVGDVLRTLGLPLEVVVGISGLFILAALIAFVWMMAKALRPVAL